MPLLIASLGEKGRKYFRKALIFPCYTEVNHDPLRKTAMITEPHNPKSQWTPNFSIGPGILLAVSNIMFLLAGYTIYQMSELKPLEDGSFPALNGIHMVAMFSVFGLLAGWASWGLVFRGIRNETKLATIAVIASAVLVTAGVMVADSYTHDKWEKSIISWAANKYGIEAATVTKYDYPGIVGKAATKSTPAVYIDPPKGIKYLTAADGKYLAELLPVQTSPESFKPYDLSKDPKLLPEKK